jgi:iron complex transport system ATP-binding protein
MGEMILDVKNLTCGYNGKKIIHDINFTVGKGEILGIIGPNGSGKTTLIRALTRILKPYSGNIFLLGCDMYNMGYNEIAKKVAVVSQEYESGWLKVEEYVLMGRVPYYEKYQLFDTAEDREITEKYISMSGVHSYRDKLMQQISGGERQLAVITRALVQEPELLLLDEPTSHLDISHQVRILDLIKRLNSELGITVVMILHDLNLAGEYCDKILLLNQGEIHSFGTPHEVLTYNAIEEVYKTVVIVENNPISKKPYVFLVSEREKKMFDNK